MKDTMIIEIKQRNFYQVLGIHPDASQHEIDHAYKRLISRFDSAGSKRSPRIKAALKGKIALLQEAYDTLSNEKKRGRTRPVDSREWQKRPIVFLTF